MEYIEALHYFLCYHPDASVFLPYSGDLERLKQQRNVLWTVKHLAAQYKKQAFWSNKYYFISYIIYMKYVLEIDFALLNELFELIYNKEIKNKTISSLEIKFICKINWDFIYNSK